MEDNTVTLVPMLPVFLLKHFPTPLPPNVTRLDAHKMESTLTLSCSLNVGCPPPPPSTLACHDCACTLVNIDLRAFPHWPFSFFRSRVASLLFVHIFGLFR